MAVVLKTTVLGRYPQPVPLQLLDRRGAAGDGAFERPHHHGAHRLARARGLRADPRMERPIDASELHGSRGARSPRPRTRARGPGRDHRTHRWRVLTGRLPGLKLREPSADAHAAVKGEGGAIMEDRPAPVTGVLGAFAEAPFPVGPREPRLRRGHADALRLLLEDDARGPELAGRIRGAQGLSRAGHGLEQTPQVQLQVRRQRQGRRPRRPRIHRHPPHGESRGNPFGTTRSRFLSALSQTTALFYASARSTLRPADSVRSGPFGPRTKTGFVHPSRRRRRRDAGRGSGGAAGRFASRRRGQSGGAQTERAIIEDTLNTVHWNRRRAAEQLGVSYKTLLNKIKECGISRK